MPTQKKGKASSRKKKSSPRKRSVKRRSPRKRSPRKSSPTRGWREASPKRGTQRHQMLERCGQACFLMKGEKFPICRTRTCSVDCRGILAAKIRAAQYHYTGVERAADRIGKRLGCSWAQH